ncbi:MAG: TetR/AcrR family transcriptional regulator [Lactobacillus sp.]|nr:TetR/AcrR family transcriptional regulator [Lactobacillus sp.]
MKSDTLSSEGKEVAVVVSSTFKNLPPAKQARIQAALLEEFSQYPLAKAKVSRIVANAKIARGAFYKYFGDLPTAYAYLRQQALASIHTSLLPLPSQYDPEHFYQTTVAFFQQTKQSKYYQFIRLSLLESQNHDFTTRPQLELSAADWAAMELCHASIRLALTDPADEPVVMQCLQISLQLLKKGD